MQSLAVDRKEPIPELYGSVFVRYDSPRVSRAKPAVFCRIPPIGDERPPLVKLYTAETVKEALWVAAILNGDTHLEQEVRLDREQVETMRCEGCLHELANYEGQQLKRGFASSDNQGRII